MIATDVNDADAQQITKELRVPFSRGSFAALDVTESTARGRIARARTHVIDYMKEWR